MLLFKKDDPFLKKMLLSKEDGLAKLFISFTFLFSFFLMRAVSTPFLYISFGLHLFYISLRFVAKGAFFKGVFFIEG